MGLDRDAFLNEIVDTLESVTPADRFGRVTRAEYLEEARYALFEGRDLLIGTKLGIVTSQEAALVLLARMEMLTKPEPLPPGTGLSTAQESAVERLRGIVEKMAGLGHE